MCFNRITKKQKDNNKNYTDKKQNNPQNHFQIWIVMLELSEWEYKITDFFEKDVIEKVDNVNG